MSISKAEFYIKAICRELKEVDKLLDLGKNEFFDFDEEAELLRDAFRLVRKCRDKQEARLCEAGFVEYDDRFRGAL